MRRLLFVHLLLALCIPAAAQATAIVALRSPDRVVFAADSLMTVAGGPHAGKTMAECKIRRHGTIWYALAGLSRDPERRFDIWQQVATAIDGAGDLASATDRVADAVASSLQRELVHLRRETPMLYRKLISEHRTSLVRLLLATMEDEVPQLAFLGFSPQELPNGEVRIEVERRACPGDCRSDGISLFFLGDHRAMDVYLKENRMDWQQPEQAAKQLIEVEIRGGTPGVGPPIDLLRIDRGGAAWIDCKPQCCSAGSKAPEARRPDNAGDDGGWSTDPQ